MKIKNSIILLSTTLLLFVLVSCKETTNQMQTNSSEAVSNTDNANAVYTSKMTKADKKKYYNTNNQVAFEIKYKPDAFKLRTAASKLLWKIKLSDDKIKISDNEENLNPFEIKFKANQQAKLVKGDKTLARTSYNPETKQQAVVSESGASPQFFKDSYSQGRLVSQIPGIPENQKKIIMDELKLKGY